MIDDAAIAAEIMRLTSARGSEKSICPSEVARALDADWRRLMAPVRRVAVGLAEAGKIDILRKGRAIDPSTMKGVIRLRTRSSAPDEPTRPFDESLDQPGG